MKKETFKVEGMVCESCEKIIKKQVMDLDGIQDFKINYKTSKAEVTFDPDLISLENIQSKITEKGYSCDQNNSKRKYWAWGFAIVGIVIALYFLIHLTSAIQLPEISSGMGYGLLFVVGLLTGFHCISMCGGFVVSYTAKDTEAGKKVYKSHFMYGLGKTISYTLIGAFFGLLGSIIAFTPM
ncbi:MAG: sulfite exporter TauE/SafE family protein, partial [Nanoarchaeota archaeon]|nr:sulfite exporter TauE/SafE family protein [Nanoarchaeota archaeon]